MSNKQTPELDGYVQSLIRHYSKEFNLNIDPSNPTREQLLDLALKLDEKGDHASIWYAMEIMVGRRIDSSERDYASKIVQYKMFPWDARKFYEGFSK